MKNLNKNFVYRFLLVTTFSSFILQGLAWADCDSPDIIPLTQKLDETSTLPRDNQPAWIETSTVMKIYKPQNLTISTQAIIAPPSGGENFLDRRLANKLCQAGIFTMILTYQSVFPVITLELTVHDLVTEEFLAQLERALRFSPNATILVGSSLGGIFSSIAYGMVVKNGDTNGYRLSFHPQATLNLIKGVSMTVSGGSIAEILTHSKLVLVKQQRDFRMQALHLNLQQYEIRMKHSIRMDTLALSNPDFSKHIQFFEGFMDSDVPTFLQENLWQAWGQPSREWFLLGHEETVFWVYEFRFSAIRDFILKYQ